MPDEHLAGWAQQYCVPLIVAQHEQGWVWEDRRLSFGRYRLNKQLHNGPWRLFAAKGAKLCR
jgi:hypothetical protein